VPGALTGGDTEKGRVPFRWKGLGRGDAAMMKRISPRPGVAFSSLSAGSRTSRLWRSKKMCAARFCSITLESF
jgi:hypothetical protein